MKDVQQDADNAKLNFQTSENKRGELQDHISQTASQISDDAARNKQFQDALIEENKRLLEEIAALKALLAQKEKDQISFREALEKEKVDMRLAFEQQLNEKDLKIKNFTELAL